MLLSTKRHRRLVFLGLICLALALPAEAQLPPDQNAPDEVLTDKDLQRLTKAVDVVAVGTIGFNIASFSSYGHVYFHFDVTIEGVINGETELAGQKLRVASGRYSWVGRDSQWPPNLFPENRVVLFMNRPRQSKETNVRYPWTLVSSLEGLRMANDTLTERLRALVDRSTVQGSAFPRANGISVSPGTS